MKVKKTKMMEAISFNELISKKKDFMASVEGMTEGL